MDIENTVANSVEVITDSTAEVYSRERGLRGTPRVIKSTVIDEAIDENSSVKDIQRKVNSMIKAARAVGYRVAADNLEHYVKGLGGRS